MAKDTTRDIIRHWIPHVYLKGWQQYRTFLSIYTHLHCSKCLITLVFQIVNFHLPQIRLLKDRNQPWTFHIALIWKTHHSRSWLLAFWVLSVLWCPKKKRFLELHLFPLPSPEIRVERNVLIRIQDVFSFTRQLFTRKLEGINFPKYYFDVKRWKISKHILNLY